MVIIAAPTPAPTPISQCSDTEYLNEKTGECVSMCADGEAMTGGVCKTVCGDERRLDINNPCITLADSEGDCPTPVSPTPVNPTPSPVVETVRVDASLSFSGFNSESFPTEGTPEYEGFKGDVRRGIATTLGVDIDKVTILAMTLGGRRELRRR